MHAAQIYLMEEKRFFRLLKVLRRGDGRRRTYTNSLRSSFHRDLNLLDINGGFMGERNVLRSILATAIHTFQISSLSFPQSVFDGQSTQEDSSLCHCFQWMGSADYDLCKCTTIYTSSDWQSHSGICSTSLLNILWHRQQGQITFKGLLQVNFKGPAIQK